MEEKKMKRVLDWPTSKKVKNIQKFLGLANYYQWFINNFTSIARLLHNLVKKYQKWDWTEKQEKVFRKLREKFTKTNVSNTRLRFQKIRIEVNVSNYTMGGFLSMKCGDRKQRPVTYLSKSLNEMERNYEIHDKEMLVVIRGLENWRYLL